jgi:hypothetical protein
LECWSVGVLECWSVGALERWSVGALERWSVGVLECWSVGIRKTEPGFKGEADARAYRRFPSPCSLHHTTTPLLQLSISPSLLPLLPLCSPLTNMVMSMPDSESVGLELIYAVASIISCGLRDCYRRVLVLEPA